MNYYFQINYYIKLRPNHSGKRSFRLVIEQPWINARYPRRTHIHTRTASHRATDVKRRVKWRITYKGTNLIARLPRAKLQRSYTIRGRPRVQYFRQQRESLSLSLSLGSREFAAPSLSLSLLISRCKSNDFQFDCPGAEANRAAGPDSRWNDNGFIAL